MNLKKKSNARITVHKDAELMHGATAELTDRERLFVLSYIQTLNGPDAALAAGYSGERHVLRSTAWRILQRQRVREAIDVYLSTVFMNVAEFKARISAIARGSLDDFIDIDEVTGTPRIDIAKASERGVLGLIKKYRRREFVNSKGERTVTSEIELYDAQEALLHIGKLHGLFKDNHAEVGAQKGEGPFEIMERVYRDAIAKNSL